MVGASDLQPSAFLQACFKANWDTHKKIHKAAKIGKNHKKRRESILRPTLHPFVASQELLGLHDGNIRLVCPVLRLDAG